MWPFVAVALVSSAVLADTSPGQDSDGDGISDADEDSNHNGLVDPGESDPASTDTDRDNVPDGVERQLGTDPARADDVPPIPEPLSFDLIRNLGSRRNELEANVLMMTTFDAVAWGPEIEWTPARNFGLELELPFENARVAALKAGAQWTITSVDKRRLEIGTIGLYEHGVHGPERRATLGAITGVRFSRMVQALTIVGPSFDLGPSRPVPGGTLNTSVFVQTSRYLTAGIELGYRAAREERSTGTLLPQIHVNPTRHVKLQLGAGATTHIGLRVKPLAAVRLSYEL